MLYYDSMDDALNKEWRLFQDVISGNLTHDCYVWTTSQCLVAPYSLSKHERFSNASNISNESGWPVYIRRTGGGITPQGPGILNTSMAFANQMSNKLTITDTYQLLCKPIIAELNQQGIHAYCSSVEGAFCDGNYNIAVNGKKLAGTAQRWSQLKGGNSHNAILAHALVLYETNLDEITAAINNFYKLLNIDKQCSSHAHCNFINLCESGKISLSGDLLGKRLLRSYRIELNKRNSRQNSQFLEECG